MSSQDFGHLRIVMLVSSDLDSDPRVQREASSAHVAGHSVTVVCRRAAGSYPYDVVTTDVEKSRLRGTLRSIAERARFAARILALRFKVHPDVVHANDLDMLFPGWLLAKRYGSALVYDAHEIWTEVDRGLGKFATAGLRRSEGFLARRAGRVITVSDSAAEYLAELLDLDNVVVVRNVPRHLPYESLDAPSLKSETGVQGDGVRFVLFHGLFRSEAGLDELIASARWLRRDIHIVLRGYGSEEAALRALAADLGVSDQIHFVSPVPMNDLIRYAVQADIGALPMVPEGSNNLFAGPNKLYEYLMAGLPLAASPIPGFSTLIEEQQVGRVFERFDARAIAETLTEMFEDPQGLAEMKARALALARRFSWDAEYQILERIYQEVAHAR